MDTFSRSKKKDQAELDGEAAAELEDGALRQIAPVYDFDSRASN